MPVSSIPGGSADKEAGSPTTHLVFIFAQPQRGEELTNCGEKLGPTVAGSQRINASPFLSLDERFYTIISYSFSGFPWKPATGHLSRGLLHYPLSPHWLPSPIPCFTPPGPHLCTPRGSHSPVKHMHFSFSCRLCSLGNPGTEGTHLPDGFYFIRFQGWINLTLLSLQKKTQTFS